MPNIELAAALARRIEKIERARTRHEGENRIFVAAFGAPMQGERRLIELAAEAAIEFGVVFRADRAFRLRPQRRAVGQAAWLLAQRFDQGDRHRDCARMFTQDLLDPRRLEIFGCLAFQTKDDAGAARRRGFESQRRDRKCPFPVGTPKMRLVRPRPSRLDVDALGDHEGRIEADAELPDQVLADRRIVLSPHPVEKSARAGTGDRAQRLGEIRLRHADPVVGDRQRPGGFIETDGDEKARIAGNERRIGECFIAQFLAGIGAIRDKLTKKNITFRIDRVDHQIEEPGHVGLKSMARCHPDDLPSLTIAGIREAPRLKYRAASDISLRAEANSSPETAHRRGSRRISSGDGRAVTQQLTRSRKKSRLKQGFKPALSSPASQFDGALAPDPTGGWGADESDRISAKPKGDAYNLHAVSRRTLGPKRAKL